MAMDGIRTMLEVNGQPFELDLPPHATLAEALRGPIGLTGTKIACNAGDCGACSVLVDGRPVPSCQMLVAHVSGLVTTVEGLKGGIADALRAAFIEEGAFQCGFCTSGQLIVCYGLVEQASALSDEELAAALSGNICRCTGYAGIVRAVRRASAQVVADAAC